MKANRWTIGRRLVQILAILLLASPTLGWSFFEGNLGSASLGGLLLSDPLASLQILLLTGDLAGPLLTGTLVVLVFYGLLGGRAFCGWVCPVGLFTDLFEPIARRTGRSRWGLHWKFGALAILLGLSLALGIPAFETLSPIAIRWSGTELRGWIGFESAVVGPAGGTPAGPASLVSQPLPPGWFLRFARTDQPGRGSISCRSLYPLRRLSTSLFCRRGP